MREVSNRENPNIKIAEKLELIEKSVHKCVKNTQTTCLVPQWYERMHIYYLSNLFVCVPLFISLFVCLSLPTIYLLVSTVVTHVYFYPHSILKKVIFGKT